MLTTPAMCKKALSSPTTVPSFSSPLSLSLDSSSVIKVCGKNRSKYIIQNEFGSLPCFLKDKLQKAYIITRLAIKINLLKQDSILSWII